MTVTATEAKKRLGQVLEQAPTRPVFIEKAGRRHSVGMSVGHSEALLKASRPDQPKTRSRQFYKQHKAWVDEQNRDFDAHGLWNEELRTW